MARNKNLVVEVCNLNEVGYPLAKTQAELTTIQKLFLLYAYPVFRKMGEDDNGNQSPSEEDAYKRKMQAEIDAKRNSMG